MTAHAEWGNRRGNGSLSLGGFLNEINSLGRRFATHQPPHRSLVVDGPSGPFPLVPTLHGMSATDPHDAQPRPGGPVGGTDHRALFAGLYAELHRLARREVRRQGASSPVGATTLLHEAYLDISRRDALAFPNQAHFLAYAGRSMRGLVIDRVRERQALKRGGGLDFTVLDTQVAEECEQPEQLAALGDALDELATLEPELANVVDLRYFCGLTMAEIAELQGVSERSVQRRWEKARLLLFRAMGGASGA